MLQLIYKDFKLAIHPLYYLVPLMGALVLIPDWVYFVSLMYFFFITIPNVFANAKAQNDISFSVLMPVRKRDVVGARIASMIILELIQIIITALFCIINLAIYSRQNSLIDPNTAFIGFVFIMYGIFNLVFFPMFYKTAYKIGLPIICAMTSALVFSAAVEAAMLLLPAAGILDTRQVNAAQSITLVVGIALFTLLSYTAYTISARRFERLDL